MVHDPELEEISRRIRSSIFLDPDKVDEIRKWISHCMEMEKVKAEAEQLAKKIELFFGVDVQELMKTTIQKMDSEIEENKNIIRKKIIEAITDSTLKKFMGYQQ